MKIENGKISEATESELYDMYFEGDIDGIMDFEEYKHKMRNLGCTIIEG